jgi:CheY-like chemotaxis protein
VLREGSAFHLYLPLMATVEEMEFEEPTLPPLAGKETLLVVEDEAELLKLVARGLRRYGYTVLEASSGEEALQVAKSYPGEISLLFTDMVMPGMNGLTLANVLQEMRPELPLVFATGYTTERFSDTDVSGRPLRLIHKPYRLNSLMEAIRDMLDAS